jgi:hypothetical protein
MPFCILINVEALAVIGAAVSNVHIARVVICFAVSAFPPVRITAGIQRAHPEMQQLVVVVVWTNNEIAGLVVQLVAVGVVDYGIGWQWLAQCVFGDGYVLKSARNSEITVCVDIARAWRHAYLRQWIAI